MINILKIGDFFILCFVCVWSCGEVGQKHQNNTTRCPPGETTLWRHPYSNKVNNSTWSRHAQPFYCTQYEQFSKTVPNTYVCVRDSFQCGKLSAIRTVFVNGTYCVQCRLIGSLRLIGTSPYLRNLKKKLLGKLISTANSAVYLELNQV